MADLVSKCLLSFSLHSFQTKQGHEENTYSFISQISKEHQLCAKCRELRACLLQVSHSTVTKSQTDHFLFFIMTIQSSIFSHLGGPCLNFCHGLVPFLFLAREFCLGNSAYRSSGQKIKYFHGSSLL